MWRAHVASKLNQVEAALPTPLNSSTEKSDTSPPTDVASTAEGAHRVEGQPPDTASKITELPKPPALQSDPNKLHASLLRARMMNDSGKIALLESQIAALASNKSAPDIAYCERGSKRNRVEDANESSGNFPAQVMVSALDARGLPIPSLQMGPLGKCKDDFRGGKSGKVSGGEKNKIGSDYERVAFFREEVGGTIGVDGGAHGTSELALAADRIRRELSDLRARDAREGGIDASLIRGITHDSRFKGLAGTSAGEDYDGGIDDAVKLLQDPRASLTAKEQQTRDMNRAVAVQKREERSQTNCALCLTGGAFRKELLVTMGEYCCLMLPPGGGRVPGHMILLPIGHVGSVIDAVSC